MTKTLGTFEIAHRFRGPPASANGGYFAAQLARFARQTVKVRLLRPPPLDAPLTVVADGDLLRALHDDVRYAEASPALLDLDVPAAPRYEVALDASLHCKGLRQHDYPGCFVCGPARARGDGLRIFAGPWREGVVAAGWIPDRSLANAEGKVAPEFMWSALDCPGYFAIEGHSTPLLLAEFTAHVDRLVHIDEPCVAIGWPIAAAGRKYEVGTALFDEDGEICGRARALWIATRA